MIIDKLIKRYGLRGRAAAKARAIDKESHSKAISYCIEYGKNRQTLPEKINETVDHDGFVDQVIAKKGQTLDGVIAAKDIYLLSHPKMLLEYLHCSKKRRQQIGVNAQFWTNSRISPKSGTCRGHFILLNAGKNANAGRRPRLLEFASFGGSNTKTGHVKCFTIASVIAQFEAEGIPHPLLSLR